MTIFRQMNNHANSENRVSECKENYSNLHIYNAKLYYNRKQLVQTVTKYNIILMPETYPRNVMPGRTDVYDNNVVNHNCSYEMSQSHTTAPTCSNSMRVDELSESN